MELREYMTTVLREMEVERNSQGRIPSGIGMIDLQRRVIADAKAELNAMCRDGIIRFHRTLNDVSFSTDMADKDNPGH